MLSQTSRLFLIIWRCPESDSINVGKFKCDIRRSGTPPEEFLLRIEIDEQNKLEILYSI